MKLIRAITPILRCDASDAKLASLDTLAAEYKARSQRVAIQQRNLATIRCKARRMNAYLYASNRLVVVQPHAQLPVQWA